MKSDLIDLTIQKLHETEKAVPRAMLPKLNARWSGVAYDSAPAELRPVIMATAKLDHAAREARRNG